VQGIDYLAALPAIDDDTFSFEDREMVRDFRLVNLERFDHIRNAQFPFEEQLKDFETVQVGQGFQGLGAFAHE